MYFNAELHKNITILFPNKLKFDKLETSHLMNSRYNTVDGF